VTRVIGAATPPPPRPPLVCRRPPLTSRFRPDISTAIAAIAVPLRSTAPSAARMPDASAAERISKQCAVHAVRIGRVAMSDGKQARFQAAAPTLQVCPLHQPQPASYSQTNRQTDRCHAAAAAPPHRPAPNTLRQTNRHTYTRRQRPLTVPLRGEPLHHRVRLRECRPQRRHLPPKSIVVVREPRVARPHRG
jgi:hypothetical protein